MNRSMVSPLSFDNRAFTLVELLVVMGVAGALLSLTVTALPSLMKSGQLNSTVSDLAGILSQARQYAVAQNTYVWVAFQPDSNAQGGDALNVAVLASKSGRDPAPWSDYGSVPNPASPIDFIGRPRTFSQTRFREAGAITFQSLPSGTASLGIANSLVNGTASFTIKRPGDTAPVQYPRIIQFTPTGEARNSAGPIDIIEFALQPTRGTVADQNNVAVIRVNGLTGQTTVHRP